DVERFFGEREEKFAEAFNEKTGEVFNEKGEVDEKNKTNFLNFINPFYQEFPPQNLVDTLKQILKSSVKEKLHSQASNPHGEGVSEEEKQKGVIDEHSLNYAWLKAWSWFLFSGGLAKNNWPYPTGDPSGHM